MNERVLVNPPQILAVQAWSRESDLSASALGSISRRSIIKSVSKWPTLPTFMSLQTFHPAVIAWFNQTFIEPTPAQRDAWPAISAGHHVLVAAPTGSGKTLAAFLAAIDALVRQGVAGKLIDETQLVYVSPLKALSNDIQKNLDAPLAGIREHLKRLNYPCLLYTSPSPRDS